MGGPRTLAPKVLSWASDLDPGAAEQAARASRLPFVRDHIALMPDAHIGIGATIGSVIATEGAIIPAAVGVDIGCGMIAARTNLVAADLPDSLDPLLRSIARAVPAGVGRGHRRTPRAVDTAFASLAATCARDPGPRAHEQLGTLGSGNHFIEVCLDTQERVWIVLHSGSRGIGNQMASHHIKVAKALHRAADLEDRDLAWFTEGTSAFDAYIADMLWAQRYAAANRALMADAVVAALRIHVPTTREEDRISCHHNFTQREEHGGRTLWITRKGAIQADVGMRGVVPGSMGARTYVVRGLGEPRSWRSCAHGAGRRLSRTQARKEMTSADLTEAMRGKAWLQARASALLDESPGAYKDIEQVMADQADLVEVETVLTQVLNYKGT